MFGLGRPGALVKSAPACGLGRPGANITKLECAEVPRLSVLRVRAPAACRSPSGEIVFLYLFFSKSRKVQPPSNGIAAMASHAATSKEFFLR